MPFIIKDSLAKAIWVEKPSTRSKLCNALDLTTIVLFGVTFFSIPALSFSEKYVVATWGLTIILLGLMGISLLLQKSFSFDLVSASLVAFAISALISSALCGFQAFKMTPILLSLLTCCIYIYCQSVKKRINIKCFLCAAFIGAVGFLALFMVKYRAELASLSFDRLGGQFGDENDIALFMAFGLICSIFYAFPYKKTTLPRNIISTCLIPLFALCGFSTGSKIFIIVLAFCMFFFPIAICGKRLWWLSLAIIGGVIAVFFVVINLPFLSSLRERLMDFISTLFGKSINGGRTGELSTVNRFDMFLCGMEMWLRKPAFGWGIWGFATFSGGAGVWSHNNISESLCNFGLIGTFFFHFGVGASLVSHHRSKDKNTLLLPLSLLALFLISMISVALNSEKIYAFIIPIVFAILNESPFKIKVSRLFLKKENFGSRGRKSNQAF